MLRKLLAASTTVLVAAGITLGAAVPAFAGDDTSDTPPTSAPSTAPAVAKDATAPVSVTPASCGVPAKLVLGTAVNATWGTPSLTTGPGDYTVVATATAGHAFADGATTTTVGGTLAGATDCTPAPVTPPVHQAAVTTSGQYGGGSGQYGGGDNNPTCIPSSVVSYTYDASTNSGQVAVGYAPSTTGALCQGFWVTATSWDYTQAAVWPQTLYQKNPANDGKEITAPGVYDFRADVRCGQGDIYASFSGAPYVGGQLNGPQTPFPEHFLHDMGFKGPVPTYVQQNPDCYAPTASYTLGACYANGSFSSKNLFLVFDNTASKLPVTFTVPTASPSITQVVPGGQKVTVETSPMWDKGGSYVVYAGGKALPTLTIPAFTGCLPGQPGDPSAKDAVCNTDGTTGNGSITVDYQPGVLAYTLTYPDHTTVPITQATTAVPAGSYVVGVTAEPGFVLSGAAAWPLTVVVNAPTDCGDIPTLADLPTAVSHRDASCSTGLGSITVGPDEATLQFVDYFIDGKKVTSTAPTALKPGTYTVTASVNPTTAAGDTLEDPGPWIITIAPASTACGDLRTLALTGTDPGSAFAAAAVLIPLGGALMVGVALVRRRNRSA